MGRPTLITPPATGLVTLAQAKAHASVDYDDDDAMLQTYLDSAHAYLDGWNGIMGRALVTQTWEETFRMFGYGDGAPLSVPPVASITSVKYWDTASPSVLQTLSGSVYRLLSDHLGDYLQLAVGQTWPTHYTRSDAITVRYVTGVADTDPTLDAIRLAIKMLVVHWYDQRAPVSYGQIPFDVPKTVDHLLAPFRRRVVTSNLERVETCWPPFV